MVVVEKEGFTTMYKPVQRITRKARLGINDALDNLRQTAELYEGRIEKYNGEWVFIAVDDDDGSEIRVHVVFLRKGESFVAIPDEYYDEGTEFTATNGDEVALTDDDEANYIGVIAI